MRGPVVSERLPSRATVHRILLRHGLVVRRPRRRQRSDYVRWQRPAAMQLWQIDIVYGPWLVDTGTGELREGRIVTGVDDHSRSASMARVVERATGRAICLAFAEALERYGAPEEVLTDNGKQFTDRFGRGGEVLFDKICRRNGIAHRLTQPRSPTTTGKIERFHQTLRRELLDDARPFVSLLAAQAALDGYVRDYNATRPHQALDTTAPVSPGQALPAGVGRAAPAVGAVAARRAVGRRRAGAHRERRAGRRRRRGAGGRRAGGGRVRSGRAAVGEPVGRAPSVLARSPAGRADRPVLGQRRRHPLSSPVRASRACARTGPVPTWTELERAGATAAGPPPLPVVERGDGGAIEVDRTVNNTGLVGLGGRQLLAAEILGGRRVSIRIEPTTLLFFDPQTRELLRTRPKPLTADQLLRLQGARPAGPPPRPRSEPVTVQRRVSATGRIVVCRQAVSLGRVHAGRIVSVHVSEHTLAIELGDDTRTVRRTTTRPVVVLKGQPPPERRPRGPRNGTLVKPRAERATHIDLMKSNPRTPTEPRLGVKDVLQLIRQASLETRQSGGSPAAVART